VRWWQTWAGHESLRRTSYLYFFLDNRLATYLPAPDRSYVDYILQDYAPGSLEWSEFERYFHTLAIYAVASAPTRVLVIYPQVPFRAPSPLQPIYDRVSALAAPHHLSIPPAAWIRYGGDLTTVGDRPAVRFTTPPRGPAIDTRDYVFAGGPIDVRVAVSIDANARTRDTPGTPGTLGTLDLLDASTNEVLSTAPLAAAPGGWRDVDVRLNVGDRARRTRLRLTANSSAPFAVGDIALPVDYGFTVVDLTASLNSFNTHASIFDAHPNERAHQVVAEKVLEALQKTAPRR
jgi:hypothetical protein